MNYKPPTYDNDEYEYPTWAHALGWFYAAASLICIPVFAVVAIVNAEGDTLFQVMLQMIFRRAFNRKFTILISNFKLQKLKNSIKPDIYECKICGEHNCEHDLYDIEESIQEMQTISPQQVPTKITLQQPPQGRPLLNNRMDHIAENK